MHSLLIYQIQPQIKPPDVIEKVRKTAEIINDIFQKSPL